MSDDARAAAERLAEYYDFMGTIEGQERDALVVARSYLAAVADRDRLAAENERLRTERVALLLAADAGERFKAFVHAYLDQHSVPHGDPTNQHQIEGCRIGARLDLLFADRDRLAGEVERLRAALGEALVPLAVLVVDAEMSGPIPQISPALWGSIREGHDSALAALAARKDGEQSPAVKKAMECFQQKLREVKGQTDTTRKDGE
jgi:hypothetical protein